MSKTQPDHANVRAQKGTNGLPVMCGVLRNGTSSGTQVSSARSPGGAGWIANERETTEALNPKFMHRALSLEGTCTGEHGVWVCTRWIFWSPRPAPTRLT